VSADNDLKSFYEDCYGSQSEDRDWTWLQAWRRLGAVGKADHVLALARRLPQPVESVLDVGCGDGALLAELQRRGFGRRIAGLEIAESAVRRAREQTGMVSIEIFDGLHLPYEAQEWSLVILSHVLEHVPDPTSLLAEARRVSAAVIIEVPLEANFSARRAEKREDAMAIGHLHTFDRQQMRQVVAAAGLRIVTELTDPLPLAVHRFRARGRRDHARATMRWLMRRALAVVPPIGERLITLHHAALLVPR